MLPAQKDFSDTIVRWKPDIIPTNHRYCIIFSRAWQWRYFYTLNLERMILMRLPNGYGTAYKLSGNRRRPFVARISCGYNEKGRAIYQYLGYYATKKEALQALADYNKNPYDLNLSRSTISDIWEIFKSRRFDKISKSGINVYTTAYKHLKPIHDKSIKDLKTYQLQALIDGINRGWQTKSHIQTLLHQMYDIALELDIVTKNYAAFIKLDSKPQSNIHKAFTKEEIQMLFDCVFFQPLADTVLIMIYTGLRPSEMLEIKTENVHLKERYIIAGKKTKAGTDRIIPINNKVLPFIQKRYNTNHIYLIEENSHALSYEKYRIAFSSLMSTLNMSHLPHDGRHTFASLMNSAGANSVATKKIMGHATSDITEKIYTHKALDELLCNVNLI